MKNRKEMTHEYKERKLQGGVYTITNTQNGKYIIAHAADLKSVENRFQFAMSVGSAMHNKLKKDCAEMGTHVFQLAILEELEQKSNQTQAEFMEELKMLEQLCRTTLDAAKEY